VKGLTRSPCLVGGKSWREGEAESLWTRQNQSAKKLAEGEGIDGLLRQMCEILIFILTFKPF
jgi:hypothetical protein